MKLIRKNKKGFTLVELIVVIAILAILALILIPAISGYVTKADKSGVESSGRALQSQAILYVSETEDPTSEGLIAELGTLKNYSIDVDTTTVEVGSFTFTLKGKKHQVEVTQDEVKPAVEITEP